ncbi:MAG: DUF167 domain-containing protein [Desulfatitalea sp.]|nr:DUF167 domain-containing protein [Desulfatitalea sp.]
MLEIQTSPRGVTFFVQVQPRASRATIVGPHQNSLKIKLTAPPVGGAANQQCIALLAKALARPKSTITITSGQTTRRKQVCLGPKTAAPMDPAEAATLKMKLQQLAEEISPDGKPLP